MNIKKYIHVNGAVMVNYILLLAISLSLSIYSTDNTMLLAELKSDLLKRAGEYGKVRSQGIMQPIFWEQAYIACVFKKLNHSQLTVSDIIEISQNIKTKQAWDLLIASETQSTAHQILSYNDQIIYPYYKLACTNWGMQQQSLDKDWREFASRYTANEN